MAAARFEMEISEVFDTRFGLILAPDFPVGDDLTTPLSIRADIVKPDGQSIGCTLTLETWHFNIPNCSDVKKRWRNVPLLSDIEANAVGRGDCLVVHDVDVAQRLIALQDQDSFGRPV